MAKLDQFSEVQVADFEFGGYDGKPEIRCAVFHELHTGRTMRLWADELRRHPKPCPVLAFTAEDESEMYGEGWSRLQAAGIDDVVRKGMNVNEALLRKVAAALGEAEPEPPPPR